MSEQVFESRHPLVKHKIDLLRRPETTPKQFRELVRELSMLLAYEGSHTRLGTRK